MNSNLANPFSIVKEKSLQAWSGCLEVAEPKDNSISWLIYLLDGKIQYATSTGGQKERLNYLWKQLKLGSDCPEFSTDNEYQQLCQWVLDRKSLNLDLNQILLKLTQEALIQAVSIKNTSVKIGENNLSNQVNIGFTLSNLMLTKIVLSWQQTRENFNSIFNRLYLDTKDSFQLYKLWKKLVNEPDFTEFANNQKISVLTEKLNQNYCLYQLATELNLNTLSLTKYLRPFTEAKVVKVLPFKEQNSQQNSNEASYPKQKLNTTKYQINNQIIPSEPSNSSDSSSRPVIACIDDSKTVQRQVKLILENIGYQVIDILDPAMALKTLYHQQPALILMDINMPTMNGYDLCSMLRRAKKFQEVPIIMLTGRDGIIDRMRAKFVGSTDYLTKPFEPNVLIDCVQKLALR